MIYEGGRFTAWADTRLPQLYCNKRWNHSSGRLGWTSAGFLMTAPSDFQSLREAGQDDQTALHSRWERPWGAGDEEGGECVGFSLLSVPLPFTETWWCSLDAELEPFYFQQKSGWTAGPQARWLPAWPSPCRKAASLPFAPDLSFLCLSSATDDFSPVSPRLAFCSVFCWLCLAVYLHILLSPLLSFFFLFLRNSPLPHRPWPLHPIFRLICLPSSHGLIFGNPVSILFSGWFCFIISSRSVG